MSHRCKIHIFQVSGDRMIEQRADGLPRGNVSEGHMKGRIIFEIFSVNNNTLEIPPFLEDWLKYWVGEDAEISETGGWFICVHDSDKDSVSKETNVEGRWILSYRSREIICIPYPAAVFAAIV